MAFADEIVQERPRYEAAAETAGGGLGAHERSARRGGARRRRAHSVILRDLQHDEHAVAKADQEEDVGHDPQEPGPGASSIQSSWPKYA